MHHQPQHIAERRRRPGFWPLVGDEHLDRIGEESRTRREAPAFMAERCDAAAKFVPGRDQARRMYFDFWHYDGSSSFQFDTLRLPDGRVPYEQNVRVY